MDLSPSQRRFLRGLTHDINPVVMVGDKGLTGNVRAEIEQAMLRHELIKVKLRVGRRERREMAQEIARQFRAELVHAIGQVACFYRRNPDRAAIKLP